MMQPSLDEWPGPAVVCSCGTEAVHVMRVGGGKAGEPVEVEFAIWKYGAWPMGWRFRLRSILRILRRGDGYNDMVVLDVHQARRLIGVLASAVGNVHVLWTGETGNQSSGTTTATMHVHPDRTA